MIKLTIVKMCMEKPSASLMNIPDAQAPERTIPKPNNSAPTIKGTLIAETLKKSMVPPDKYFIEVIPKEATRMPMRMDLSWVVEFMENKSAAEETKHNPERCSTQPKMIPKNQYKAIPSVKRARSTPITRERINKEYESAFCEDLSNINKTPVKNDIYIFPYLDFNYKGFK